MVMKLYSRPSSSPGRGERVVSVFLSLVVERIGWLVGSFVCSFVVGGGGEDGGGKTEMRRRVETNEKRKTQRWRDTRRIAV